MELILRDEGFDLRDGRHLMPVGIGIFIRERSATTPAVNGL
jgi:hypothetical protein